MKTDEFEVGGIVFQAIRKERPRKHWAFKLVETGEEMIPGTAGVSSESRPKMIANLEEEFRRGAKGSTQSWRKSWGLKEVQQ